MKRKYMNTDNAQWKEPELTTLISEVGGSGEATQYTALGFLHEMPPPLNIVVKAD